MPCPGSLLDDGSGNCVDPQSGFVVIPSSAGPTSSSPISSTLTPPSSGGSATGNDISNWANLISGFGLGVIKLTTSGNAPAVSGQGIPTSKTALAPVPTSKYTGYAVLGIIGLLLFWAFKRVRG